MNRRQFLQTTAFSAAALTTLSCRTVSTPSARDRIAFNTANLVGRVSGYRYELKHWG
jgi:hypothetical protein